MSIISKGLTCQNSKSECSEVVVQETTVAIQSNVNHLYKYIPLTGVYSVENDISGWEWDKRLLENSYVKETLYTSAVGGHLAGLQDGTKEEFWQSGSILNTNFLHLDNIKYRGEFLSWTPIVKAGKYSIFFEDKNLYSDFSSIEKINHLNTQNGVHKHQLREDGRHDTVSVILYRRDAEYINHPHINYRYVEQFTGELTESLVRLETVDSDGTILWENLSDRHYEFIINDNNEIILNKDAAISVGCVCSSKADVIKVALENLGNGSEEGRNCYTEYYPIADGSLDVYVVEGSKVTEWKEVENLNFSTKSDNHYTVDHDLGIVTLGGYQAPDLILHSDIDMDSTEIKCFLNDDAFSSYPPQGIIQIGEEKILYYNKGRNRFYDCIRGYDDTIPASHALGSVVSDTKHGAGSKEASKVYLSYMAIPRVEYEVTDSDKRTANRRPVLDVRPGSNVVTNNIIQIQPQETHVAKLVLETDSPYIGGNLYGPVYYGTDVSKLTARALDSRDNPVEGIDITIVLASNNGGLNGFLKTYTDISNTLGEIYAFYNAPYDWDSISKDVYSVTHDGDKTIFSIEEIPPGVTPEEVQVYQVLKHDRTFGTQGHKFNIANVDNDPLFDDGSVFGGSTLVIDEVFEDASSQWTGGRVEVLSGGVVYSRKIIDAMDVFQTVVGTPGSSYGCKSQTRLFLETNIPGMTPANTSACWAWEKDARTWNSKFLDGVSVVLYEWKDKDVYHPIPNDDGSLNVGAYYPVRPDIVEIDKLTFNNRLLGLPKPTDINSNLGGYLVVASDIVSLYAYCKDPVSGKTIISNKVRLRIDIPPYLNGVDFSGRLPIPYGFGFVTEEFNVGTGLGGANFLTINPKAEGINTFNLNVNIG